MRFWLVVVAFALVNLAAWLGYHAWVWPGADRAHVVDCSRGDGDTVAIGQTVWWRFDRAMAPGDLERDPPARTAPTVPGTWRWSDERTLVFVAKEVPTAAPFAIEFLPGRLAGRDGREARRPPTLHVHSPVLAASACRAVGAEEGGRYVIELVFTEPVAPAAVLAHLSAKDAWGRTVGLEAWSGGAADRVRVITEAIADRRDAREGVHLDITLAPGLVGLGGPLGLERELSWPLLLDPSLLLESVKPAEQRGGQAAIQLTFNRSCSADRLRRVLSLEPAAPFALSGSGSSWTISGELACGQRYAVVLSAPPAGSPAGEYPRPDRATVTIPDREPKAWFEHDSGYLGASGNRAVLAHTVNLRQVTLSVWRVYDANLVAWRPSNRWGVERLARPLAERTISVATAANTDQALRLALDDVLPEQALADGVYRLRLSWREEDETARGDERSHWRSRDEDCVVSLSDIGLQARLGPDGLDAWCWSLGVAAPLPGTRVRLYSSKNQPLGEAVCDADGRARFALAPLPSDERPAVLIAERRVADEPVGLTWLDLDSPVRDALADTGGRPYLSSGHEAFVYADRGVYRPGETAHLRALVRAPGGRAPQSFPVVWRILRPDLRVWREIPTMLPAGGDAAFDLDLPADLPTGRWTAKIALPGGDDAFGATPLQVEDFLPQRLKAAMMLGTGSDGAERWALSAGAPPASVRGDYLFGSPASGLEARLSARIEPATFAPPTWKDWTFDDAGETAPRPEGDVVVAQPTPLGADGVAHWSLGVAAIVARTQRPWRLVATGSVLEPGGRAVTTGARSLEIDPLPAYLGLKLDGAARVGEVQRFALRVVRTDAGVDTSATRAIDLDLSREEWNTSLVKEGRYYHYQSQRALVAVGKPMRVMLNAGSGAGSIAIPSGGRYVLRASDPATGQIASIAFYTAGDADEDWSDSISREHPDRCEVLVAPRAESPPPPPELARALRVGATAAITVRSPFAGRLLLVVETDRIVATRVVELTANATTIELPVEPEWLPNAYITATVARAIDPDAPWRVHRAFGVAKAAVVDPQRRVDVAIAAPSEVRPGMPVAVDLRLVDREGTPLGGAAATVAAVDEGILRLTGFTTPDPYAWFTAARGRAFQAYDCYDQLMPEVARPGGESPTGGDGDGDDDEGRYSPPIAAKRVRSVVWWSGELRADADGRIHAEVPVPATFAGQLRLMVVGDRGASVGSGEATVLVRSPLMVQTSWPRFAAPGDRFSVPVTVFNHGAQRGTVTVRLSLPSDDPLACAEPEHRLEVPAGGDATISFAVTARRQCGVAHARIVASLGEEQSLDEVELPVRPPSPTMTVGDEMRASGAHPAAATVPGDFLPGTLAIDARLGPLPTLSLPAGLEYLYRYPYGCAEQTVSGCFPLLCLRDLGGTIAPELFSADGLAERLRVGIQRLQAMQTEDGGLAMWAGARSDWPWASVYAAHFLVEARAAGVAVPDAFLARLLAYVRTLGGRAQEEWIETQCYAAYVLAEAGAPDQALMHRLEDTLRDPRAEERAGPSCRFHLSAAWLAAGRRDLAVALLPQALPVLGRQRHLRDDLASTTRDRAVLLSTLLDVAPDNPALPRLAQELSDRASWRSTQDTAFAALALGKYLRHAAHDSPYSAARLTVDGAEVGATSGSQPLAWHGDSAKALAAIITAPSDAVGWFSWTATGVPLTPPPPADNGLRIERSWTGEDGKPKARIVSGDLVRVTLSVHSAIQRFGVALEDLLPAGFEVENPRLEGSAGVELSGARVDLRDDRVVIFDDLAVDHGDWRMTHSYLVRAVTAGTFIAPPARAECMYDLTVSGIGETGAVVVEPRR